jgi:hypothetical protein
MTGLERLAPIAHAAVLDELVEVRARDGDSDTLVAAHVLGDLRAGHLDAVELYVAAAAQLEPDDELEVVERRHLVLEALDALLDERLRVGRGHSATIPMCAATACSSHSCSH